ncbi:DUF3551 domain-containing protein [Bradyrhizobium sp. dw_78]|uniref:DUF3551 domain-containing protein n=1 Tax=Bradyrhizobium sp. dw_78 TaxID=2719793 RepID=UPI001BD4E6F7|nr:DUF3551 domain-containing protein [Bradyrhizobium sp. dw_78]
MRSLLLLATLGVLGFAGSPASAAGFGYTEEAEYPYCLQGREYGTPGLCEFSSYQQCEATASGTFSYCGANPWFAFAQEPRPRLPRHHHRREIR